MCFFLEHLAERGNPLRSDTNQQCQHLDALVGDGVKGASRPGRATILEPPGSNGIVTRCRYHSSSPMRERKRSRRTGRTREAWWARCERRVMIVDRKTISIRKACELVGVSRRTIYNWTRQR